jgi:hypothetical protein
MSFNVLHCKFTKYEDYGGAAKDEFGLFFDISRQRYDFDAQKRRFKILRRRF